MLTHTHTHAAPLPESQVATQLLDSIKAKETTDKMATVLDSLASLDPELGQNRDGEKRMGGGMSYPVSVPGHSNCENIDLGMRLGLFEWAIS